MRAELCGPSARGINIAVAAIDWYVATSTRDRVAFRFVSRTDRRRDITCTSDSRSRLTAWPTCCEGSASAGSDRLFVLAGRVPELYVTVFGALKNGTVVSPLFSAFGPAEDAPHLFGDGNVLVTTEALYRRKVAGMPADLPTLEHVFACR